MDRRAPRRRGRAIALWLRRALRRVGRRNPGRLSDPPPDAARLCSPPERRHPREGLSTGGIFVGGVVQSRFQAMGRRRAGRISSQGAPRRPARLTSLRASRAAIHSSFYTRSAHVRSVDRSSALFEWCRPCRPCRFLQIHLDLREQTSEPSPEGSLPSPTRSPRRARWNRPRSLSPVGAGHVGRRGSRQLWRDRLLAVAMQHHVDSPYATTRLLVVHHPEDHSGASVYAGYRALLREGDNMLGSISLDRIVNDWATLVEPSALASWLKPFRARYLDLFLSAS